MIILYSILAISVLVWSCIGCGKYDDLWYQHWWTLTYPFHKAEYRTSYTWEPVPKPYNLKQALFAMFCYGPFVWIWFTWTLCFGKGKKLYNKIIKTLE